MTLTYQPGDLGVSTGNAWDDRLIKLGQHLHGAGSNAKWDHAFIITDHTGGTIEAQAQGVVRMNVTDHPQHLIIPCPAGVNRTAVVNFANSQVGLPYDYLDDVLLGIDCLARHLNLHEHREAWICSELAAAALVAGGWHSPRPPAMTYPYDIAALIQT